MISVAEAEAIVEASLPDWGVETVALGEARGRTLQETVRAGRAQPPFDRVTMDGIAIRSGDVAAGRREFRVTGVQAAGEPGVTHGGEGTCLEIMTGAILPAGADCIVPVEDLAIDAGRARLLESAIAEPWRFVHREGSDYAAGQVLLTPPLPLHGPEIAVLASEGVSRVAVARLPRITVVATGDELVGIDATPAAHQIRSSNAPAMAASIGLAGLGRVSELHLPDDPDRIRAGLAAALEESDVLVLSGGVSRGRFDYVPEVLGQLDVRVLFHRVSQRPGKPMWFGVRDADARCVFALPGNPVSSLVCLHRYVLPALAAALGQPASPLWARLEETVSFRSALTWFLPVRVASRRDGTLAAGPQQVNTSGDFASLAGTSGFLELPAGDEVFERGFRARFFPWQPACMSGWSPG